MRTVSAVSVFAEPISRASGKISAAKGRYPFERERTRRLRTFRTGCLWLLLLAVSVPAVCIDRDRRLEQLYHTAWTAKDGAPGDITSLAQTTDGYLWIGTKRGLFRFDGIHFVLINTFPAEGYSAPHVLSLLAVPDGGLWIGYSRRAVSLFRNGKFTTYSKMNGFEAQVYSFARDTKGGIWAAGLTDGLLRFDGQHWKRMDAELQYSGEPIRLFHDRGGRLLAGTLGSVSVLAPGNEQFHKVADHLQVVGGFAQSTDGTIWIAETGRSVRPFPLGTEDSKTLGSEIHVGSGAILFDRSGSLWITTGGDGLRRVPYPERLNGTQIGQFSDQAEIFTQKQGLSDDYVSCILEDREGNIWTGSSGGLDRFRQSALVSLPFPTGSSGFSLSATKVGEIQVNISNRPLMRIENGRLAEQAGEISVNEGYRLPKGYAVVQSYVANPSEPMKLLAKSHAVVGTADRPKQYDAGKILGAQTRYLSEGKRFGEGTLSGVAAVTEDREGRKWWSIRAEGTYRTDSHGWTSLESLGGPGVAARAEFTDAAGHVWFGFSDSVAELTGERVHIFTSKDGLETGPVGAFAGCGSAIWIGGEKGIVLYEEGRFRPLIADGESNFPGVRGIIATVDHGLWIAADRGVIYVPKTEIEKFRATPGYRVKSRTFGFLDGLNAPIQLAAYGDLLEGKGILYFATSVGVVWVDPQRIRINTVPPPLSIESLIASGMEYQPSDAVRLPAKTSSIEIRYTAPSLSQPERVMFRYKLDRSDRDWQDVGARRDAIYTNLGPGKYVFHVKASNEDGIWNDTGATMQFVIAPAFYQTWWFRSFYTTVGIGMLWLLYRYRLKHATEELQERMGARMEERERIARELHDTLLQGFQGLVLRFQAVMKTLPSDQPAHQMMEKVLDRADEVLLEGRQSVRDIREEGTTGVELSEALLQCGEELARDHTSVFSLTVVGEARPIGPIVFNESYRIAREALINAFQHSHAIKIEVEITYNESRLCVRIRDDCESIDGAMLSKGRSGHWGLSGMRERAQKIGAQLDIWSHSGAGTEIELRIPAVVAYPGGVRESFWERLRRIAGRKSGGMEHD